MEMGGSRLWVSVCITAVLGILAWSVPGYGFPAIANMSACHAHRDWGNCCTLEAVMRNPPVAKTLKEYLEKNPLPKRKRFRPAAHLVSDSYAEQYDRAYQLIRALPNDDPCSLVQQANLHCMYGSPDVRPQLGFPDKDYQVHKSWLLMPFHRWYEFFHERILAKLLGDETFALPFWNWDNQGSAEPRANAFPALYRQPDKYPNLFDPNRQMERTMNPNLVIDLQILDIVAGIRKGDPVAVAEANNALLWDILCNKSSVDDDVFYSPPLRAGGDKAAMSGDLEATPHGAIHVWTGNHLNSQWEDMGRGYSAARDPIFHAHHANMDRLWNVWLEIHGKGHIQDPDFLNAAFWFYDENAELVKVTVAESLNFEMFMYEYQEVEAPWQHYNNHQCAWTPEPDSRPEYITSKAQFHQEYHQHPEW